MALALEERGVDVVLAGHRQDVVEETHRALVEHPGRRAVGVALDPAVDRDRRRGRDAGQGQRP